MSDEPREEEIYQALAPGGSYKSGLVNPVAAQQDTTVSIPMRFKGAMGGQAVGNEEYPDHEPRTRVPYKHYKDLEDIDPKLHEAVTHVADEIHIPRTDLASLVYANSDYNPQARNGMRTGYMGLTPDDARTLDPEGHLDINDPIDNLFLGAMKYKRVSNRFGMGTPNAFAAYHGGGDRIHSLLDQDPDEHRRMAPDGTFDFLNKVLGRDEPVQGDAGGGGAPTGPSDNRDMQVRAPGQNQFPNQMFGQLLHPNAAGIYGSGERPPPEGDVVLPSAGYRSARSRNAYMPQANYSPTIRRANEANVELQNPGTRTDGYRRIAYDGGGQGGDVAAMAAAAQAGQQPQRHVPAQGAVPPMYPNQPRVQGPPQDRDLEPAVGAALAQTRLPTSAQPATVWQPPSAPPVAESYEGPPEGVARRIMPPTADPNDTYEGPPEGAPPRTAPIYDPPMRRGYYAEREVPSQATQDVLADREREDRNTSAPLGFYSRASRLPNPQPNYDLNLNAALSPPSSQPPGDTDWQRPIPPGPPQDDTDWQRQMPPPREPALTGAYGPLAPPPPPAPPAIPDTSGRYGVGGALRQTPPTDPGEPPPLPSEQLATTGSGAPPAAPRQQAIGTDQTASQLNQQELALSKAGGTAPTTGSGGPTPAPAGAGYGAAPPANLPAGAPRALAPPGSAPTPTSAPPIDRLKGNGGAMTPASAVRAGAQGSDGVLTHIARNGPRGMSMGEGWDHYEDLLVRALIMKGDINGIQHAQEYVFRQKHKGAMENMMQAIASMDDPETAVRFLARSHAFVTDGTAIGFQVLNNQIYGQKYDEQTHDKIGKPFQVTEGGLRKLALAYSPPDKFNAALNQERQTNETGRHNLNTERHADEQLKQQEAQSLRSLEEKKLEFDVNQKRFEDAAQQRKHEAEQLDKRQRDLQADRLAETTRNKELDRIAKEAKDADAAAARQAVVDQRAAEEKAGHASKVEGWVDQYFGGAGMPGSETDPKAPGSIPAKDVTRARDVFAGMLHHDKTVTTPGTAIEHTRNYLAGKYTMAASQDKEGKKFISLRDPETGDEIATVPAAIWQRYLPKQDKVPAVAPAAGKPK